MKLYLDTEFNGFGGALISMALVAEDGREWYEALPCAQPVDWVMENVIPVLGKPHVTRQEAQTSLQAFLSQWEEVCVIADWPEDIAHFCQFLITGPGRRLKPIPELSFRIIAVDYESETPHNALADARGIRSAVNA